MKIVQFKVPSSQSSDVSTPCELEEDVQIVDAARHLIGDEHFNPFPIHLKKGAILGSGDMDSRGTTSPRKITRMKICRLIKLLHLPQKIISCCRHKIVGIIYSTSGSPDKIKEVTPEHGGLFKCVRFEF